MSEPFPTTLEMLLKQELAAGTSRFIIDAAVDDSGQVTFTVKPNSAASFLLDFRVRNNQLTTVFFRRSKTLGSGSVPL